MGEETHLIPLNESMDHRSRRIGEAFILAAAVLWGLFPVVTTALYTALPPIASLAWSVAFSAVFFLLLFLVRGQRISLPPRATLMDILWVTLLLAFGFYLLLFIGLRETSPGNASIIGLTEVFFSFLFFHIWRREEMTTVHIIGALVMVIGAFIVLSHGADGLRRGDLLVLAANALAPIGNYFQRRARQSVSSETILLFRSIGSTALLFLIAAVVEGGVAVPRNGSTLGLLAMNGVVIFGISKIFWIEGIHRISVIKANALSCIAPAVALLCAWLLLGLSPTLWQLLSLPVMGAGMVLLTQRTRTQLAVEV